jgi:hypothetical protein
MWNITKSGYRRNVRKIFLLHQYHIDMKKRTLKEQCLACKHTLIFGCKSFPEGIPDRYAMGIKIHNKVDPEQEGSLVREKMILKN